MIELRAEPEAGSSGRATRVTAVVRGVLTAALLYLVFAVVVPGFAPYDEIWRAITSLRASDVALLLAGFVALEVLKPLTNAILLPDLGLRRAMLADASASAVSNTVPGPSGTATRFVFYKRYGIDGTDFSRASLVNSVANWGLALLAPAVAVPLLALERDVSTRTWVMTLTGLAVAVAVGGTGALVWRSERFSAAFGAAAQTAVGRGARLARREAPPDVVGTLTRLRLDTGRTLATSGRPLAVVVVARYVTTFAVLLVAVRATGADRGAVSLLEVFAVFTVVEMLAIVQITPGGIGVHEALLVTGLALVAVGTQENLLVASVLVFRIVTFVLPIAFGAVCYLLVSRGAGSEDTAG